MKFPQKILVVTAHPDDESFLAGGTLLKNIEAGGSNFLVCGTLGEKGKAYLDAPLTEEALRQVRKQELEKATGVLGITKLRVDVHVDGKLSSSVEEFKKTVEQAILDWQPDIILGFGEDGYTGHSDHIAAFKVGLELAKEHEMPYMAFSLPTPEDIRTKIKECLTKKRACDCYEENDGKSDGCVTIPINGQKKLEILRAYKSQWKGLNPHAIFPKDVAEHFLQYEYFVQY